MQSLKEIMPAARNNINTQFIVLEKGRITLEGGENKTCLGLVADESASVHFQFWNEECEAFQPGDIVRLSNGIFSYNRSNHLVLRAGKRGKVEKVGEFTMAFVESPNMSEISWVPDPNNSGKYIQESIISPRSRIFPPMV
ncbi:putative nucleic acid-binding protein [Helianthus annuus]|uniref:Nucleic acid-binding protein n=2 Tax=Helianthus annuus TaxID=4232 RepID=A0A9K3JLB7_HELAN|nr:SOSS complex subunit B homolog [Helianthus annuus]KAF5816762.1 putative nucleic acid-binding protein [Helianthus annuus]KAJ0610025.1 putative nucleic acid-binding protein [Helianthus annuus]KAJ0803303.1 putative nucleic acid-binding protein [Helianthus annuus]